MLRPKNWLQRKFPTSEAFKMIRKLLALSMSLTLILSGCGQGVVSTPPGNGNANTTPPPAPPTPTTASAAIKHVVVIFDENISFDHYFGTYPVAANLPSNKSQFTAKTGTPVPVNLTSAGLIANNPNTNILNLAGASKPFRLDIAQAS